MITLALSQLLYFIYLQTPFTHGEDGIQGIPQGYLFGIFNLANPTMLYYVILAGFLFGFLLIFRTINSPFGEVLKSIRENEQRAISLGYKTDQYKLLAYILSGTLAGFAGSLKVFVAQNASLTDVHWSMSGEIVLMTLVGGLGTVFGPVVGAFVIIAMQQYLAGFGQWVTVIQGVIFVVCVLTFRRGVIGEIAHYFRARSRTGSDFPEHFRDRYKAVDDRVPAAGRCALSRQMVYDSYVTGRSGRPFPQAMDISDAALVSRFSAQGGTVFRPVRPAFPDRGAGRAGAAGHAARRRGNPGVLPARQPVRE